MVLVVDELVVVVDVELVVVVLEVLVVVLVVDVLLVVVVGAYVKLTVLKITGTDAEFPHVALIVYVPATQLDEPPRTNLSW